ncbi:hypothetical protein [Actinoplanes sp. URMC 104]|uniref:hypothetical protein n=1 Tax=Actinoplanes sp. URMC 104 TaxID=3423409 RepID=UPI003F1B3085
MSTEQTDTPRRIRIDPDPAWDGYDDTDGVLSVEISWAPDALAGRPPQLIATPELVAALSAAELTGYRTGEARVSYDEDAFDVEEGDTPPPMVRLVVEDTPEADFSYRRGRGLTVSERALAVLQAHCRNLTVTPPG